MKAYSSCSKAPLILLTLLVGACTTTTTQSFNVIKNSRVEASIIAVDADFGRYDRLMASDMGIFFPTDAAPSADDQDRIRAIFRRAFLSELEGYRIVRESGPSALNVQATLVDFRNASGNNLPRIRRELEDLARPGALLFLMELKDSETDRVLARAADSASAPRFSVSDSTATDWTEVEAAAARWARLFREFLDANLRESS